MTKQEQLNELYQGYNLSTEDYHKHQHYTILTRTGIEKVQAGAKISVRFEDKVLEKDFAVIKAIGTLNDKTIETYGSAKYGGYKDGNSNTWYIAEMAEKRALSRVVLKLTGMYSLGVFGEDESEDFEKKDLPTLPSKAFAKAESQILKGETTYESIIKVLREHYSIGASHDYALKAIKAQEK